MPEQARAVAKELGLPYYETSVLTYFGVNQVKHVIQSLLNLNKIAIPGLFFLVLHTVESK